MTKMYKLMFTSMLIMSTLISISAYTWLGMWIGLEINLLSLIPIIQSKSIMSSESSIKYFITQAIASTIIMLSMIMMMWKFNFSSIMNMKSNLLMIMNSGLILKMGMAPLHFWFPEVLEGLNWNNCLIMLTWQKITPMMLIMLNIEFSIFYSMIIISAMIISGIMSINQISMRKLMAFSSINHMGWMMSMMMTEKTIWMLYFVIYSIITINITMMMKNIFYLNQLFTNLNVSPSMKMFFTLNFLSLSGIPPFLGFMPKWMVIQTMIENNMFLMTLIMIMFTLIMIYVYIRIIMTSLLMKTNQLNWNMKLNMKINKMSISMLNFLSMMSLILVTIMLNLM
uniref:NADH-ubiquinone oxidoreductase chain 2 n=1 Tax=Abscondita anceyi TaxID=2307266 RepID=A0A346T613_9COLE|nr:NADH dehydrogenase subunit 2 [Abscondita anceyi]AXU05696.1 NADH dehydrogenase subunit 2 [Abscondita anceyi]UYG49039.1 NADH dehydrogenase subunit 2 [Abscondita chinensis]UYG49052.1 NADH dehydrogenase subunit 2 [Abscondita chinensis]